MATSDRPSGLTALAVINFIFSSVELLGAIGLVVSKAVVASVAAPKAEMNPEAAAFASLSWLDVLIISLFGVLTGILLVVSGIGYLKRKRFLGRWLGNAYAATAVVYVVVSLAIYPTELTGGISLDIIRSFFYPLFTVFLLNAVFRKDLVR